MASRQQNVPAGGPTYTIKVVGHRPTPLRDLYHALLLAPWSVAFGVIALGYLAVNALFTCAYLALGGVANARPGSFVDAFYFSVQTMGTIGYGSMYPASHAANVVVVGESIAGLLITSLAAGLVFAKFSRPTARVVFSRRATISRMDGEPTLQFRVSNQRGNQTVDALFRVVLVRTEQTLFPAELNLASIRAQVFASSVNIYKAMGGGWVSAADQLTARPPVPAASQPVGQPLF